ncbi:hypothetical protein E8E12_002640 [Didymella heteroderae]|uniref:Transmembrane protein n=1 Tax=Didymella heteroderae TaxID=1769908 RepID=A0A9P5C249_9PLEO|nr:hypothetical protein E8E12_002640 [Didymella heteroderae]
MNRDYRPKLRVSLIKNLTKPAFKNPFTFVSQLDITNTDDGKTSEALTGSDLAWKMLYTGPQSELLPIKFIFSCSTSVWDVVYTMSDGRVQTLVANTSNSTVTGAVSMMASSYSNPFRLKMNEVYQEVNSNTTTITPEEVTKRYELEMSKALISGLIVNTVALPVDAAQLRRNEVVTRLPAVALWFLVSTNFLFMLLAISLAIWATRSSSTEVHQAQLRLSSAGLAAQLFSHQTSTLAVKDDFELFHDKENIIEGEEEKLPLVTICSSALGGAEFVVQSTSKASDDSEQERYSFIGRPAPRLANRVTL